MNISEWLLSVTNRLKEAGIGTAHLDCLILLEDALQKDRSWLLAHPEYVIPDSFLRKLQRQLKRRAEHEPLAYIRGKTEFYGRDFFINRHVLEPRPETETMVDLLKNLWRQKQETGTKTVRIVDVGTGSGCLAVTAKLEVPEAEVIAIDIDPDCLILAIRNAKKLGADVKFLRGSLLEPLIAANQLPTVVLANLPYVPDGFTINQAAMNEPRHAIFGGPDGLDLYRSLFAQIQELKHPPQFVLTETLPFQHNKLQQIAKSAGYKLQETADFIQCFELSNYS